MGWWSPTILGGDTPLDAVCDIETFAEIPHEDGVDVWRNNPVLTRTHLEAVSLERWRQFLDRKYDADIYAQVVVLMHMEVGAVLPPELSQRAIQACQEEDVTDWRLPQERTDSLQAFVAQIQNYTGTPVQVPQEGLFEKIAQDRPISPGAH